MNGVLDYCFIVIAIISIIMAIKVVPEHLRLVVFRLGRPLDKPKGPGLVFLIPVIDRAVKVDLREQMREVLDQTARTQDSEPVLFSFCWYFKVLNPVKSVLRPANQEAATEDLAITTLREFIGGANSVDIVTSIESYNAKARTILDKSTNDWGVKITNFEILNIAVDNQQ